MKTENKPLIYLLNTEISVEEKLQQKGFNAEHYWMNGREEVYSSYASMRQPYQNDLPGNLHEAEIVVIYTGLSDTHRPAQNSPLSVFYRGAPSSINFFPLDMFHVIDNIYSTQSKQCLIIFCESNDIESYEIEIDNRTVSTVNTSTYPFRNSLSIERRVGKRIHLAKTDSEKEIKNCLSKYLEDSHYKIIFKYPSAKADTPLLLNESNEVISMIRRMGDNKTIILLPVIAKKEEFLAELLDKVLPEHPDFTSFFPNNGSFSWITKPSYISIEERNKIIDIENELARHDEAIAALKSEYTEIHNKNENIKLRNILKETGDELVYSVKWFLEYIGFENIVNPDEDVNEEAGELFEEDLNFEYDGLHFLLEVKGLGGTSTDYQCSQVSKIELRRRRQFPQNRYKAVYIVNHQRYKEPKDRQSIPFTPEQIENAEMTYRGMTFTYELFTVYHMLEKGVLKKEDVREAFKQDGVIDFRRTLNRLSLKSCLRKYTAYSFNLDGSVSITKADKIAIQDNQDHWHLLDIVNIQVNNADVDEAAEGSAGIQVSQLVEGARDYYLVKA